MPFHFDLNDLPVQETNKYLPLLLGCKSQAKYQVYPTVSVVFLVPSPPVFFDETIDRGSESISTGLSLPKNGPKSFQCCKSLHL